MANTYLLRTLTSTGNRKLWTWSAWIKKAIPDGTEMGLFGLYEDGANYFRIRYKSDQRLGIDNVEGNTTNMSLILGTEHRDVSGWYHLVVKYDSAQSTASNRVKIYVNGVLQTVFQSSTYPSQNANTYFPVNALPLNVGRTTNNKYFDGSMSHIHFTDGYAYDASAFGSTDATTGEWKINTSPSVTYGTNGFFILKDGNSVTDQSGNSNNFTVGGGTLTKTEDCPSNVFATFNPLLDVNAKPTLSNGNTTMAGAAISSAQFAGSTICVSNGKWYFEAKVTPNSSSPYVGVIDAQSTLRKNANYFVHTASGTNQSGYAVNMSGDIYHNNSNSYAANIGSISSGDILGFAIDLDSAQRTCEIYKNGASQRSFNLDEPTSGAYMLGCCSSYNTASASVNFGNGYFGTTAVSSAGTNASGNGIFEYDVPTGYTALSTKGLNL